MLAALALTLTHPEDGHGQARIAPSWLECLAPNESEVRVVGSPFRSKQGHLRRLAPRAASACRAAGYSHYVPGATSSTTFHVLQRVYFTDDSAPPARPCAFSATAELEAEASEMARVNGYPWPVGQVPAEAERWTFRPGENDWGESLPFLDEIAAPIVPALRSDQEELLGTLLVGRNCAATVLVGHQGAESADLWAYADGSSDSSDSGPNDRILEVRVDGASVKKQGRNVTKPTAGMVASSMQTFGVAVRSAEHEDNAAFEWAVTDGDRATIREHFPHCAGSALEDGEDAATN